jgi:hypothetical protein
MWRLRPLCAGLLGPRDPEHLPRLSPCLHPRRRLPGATSSSHCSEVSMWRLRPSYAGSCHSLPRRSRCSHPRRKPRGDCSSCRCSGASRWVAPPSVVCRIAPAKPTAVPVFASTKETPQRLFVGPLLWGVHVVPPFVVRRIVPKSPDCQKVNRRRHQGYDTVTLLPNAIRSGWTKNRRIPLDTEN